MAKTLADCRSLTRIYLDEASAADWTDAEVLIGVNTAYQDLASRVMEVYEEYYATINPFQYKTVANQQEYLIDTSLVKITRVEINYQPTNTQNFTRAVRGTMDEMLLQLNLNPTPGGSPLFNAAYYVHGDQTGQYIGFIPIPTLGDTALTNSIRVWGIQVPADLVQNTDVVNIPYVDRFYSLIGLRAAALLVSKGQQEESASTKYYTMYESGVKEMQTFLNERQADGVNMIHDVEIQNVDFETMAPF